MNKSGVFLVIFILLLGVAVVPTGPDFSATQIDKVSVADPAAAATTGTMKIPVSQDTAVENVTPNTNYDGSDLMFVGTGYDGIWHAGRSWFKFDLSYLPRELSVQSATFNTRIDREWAAPDEPVGVYHCTDDTWDATLLTWNLQPTIETVPSDVIDSPASPAMFEPMQWYSWDVTQDVRLSMSSDDMILTEVLKQVEEVGTMDALCYVTEMDFTQFNASYLEIEYTTPTVSELTVDGIASGPLLDFINSDCPELGWTFSDPDFQDFQKDYDVEIWNTTYYNTTKLWQSNHEYVSTIHDSNSVTTNSHPFGLANEFRMQLKYPNTEIPRSGIVDKLYFTTATDSGETAILEDFEISMVLVPSATDLTANFDANYEGRTPTIVLSRDTFEISAINNLIEVDLENTFFVNENLNLIVEIRLMDNTGDLIRIDRTDSGGPGSAVYSYGDGEYESTSAINVLTRTYDLKIGYLTETVHTGNPSTFNLLPFGTTPGYSGRVQLKYNQSVIDRAGYVDKAYFLVDELSTEVVFENFTVTLVESPVAGQIYNGTWIANYGGATAYTVVDSADYRVKNVGGCLTIDFDNSFYYTNTYDLLIDIQWDELVSGNCKVMTDGTSYPAFRAYDVRYGGSYISGNDTAPYNLLLDFVNDDDSTPLDTCITLTEATSYYWRVRTCDSFGMWGDWTTHNFKFETSTDLPAVSTPSATPSPVVVDNEVTVSADATHTAGIYAALIEYGGSNHSMTADGDTYSFAWTPTSVGLVNYTVYVRSNENTWASVTGSFNVIATGTFPPIDTNTLLIILGVLAVVVIIIVIRRRKKK